MRYELCTFFFLKHENVNSKNCRAQRDKCASVAVWSGEQNEKNTKLREDQMMRRPILMLVVQCMHDEPVLAGREAGYVSGATSHPRYSW